MPMYYLSIYVVYRSKGDNIDCKLGIKMMGLEVKIQKAVTFWPYKTL